jgi:acyl-CoA thioesterase FadM
MSGMVRKWPVLQEHPVTAADLAPDGVVGEQGVARWVEAARSEYVQRCEVVQRLLGGGARLRARITRQPPGASLGRPEAVVVSAGVTEIRPDSFSVAVRLRPVGGEHEVAVNAACLIQLEDPATGDPLPITDDIRDELIALEHAAAHYN